MANSLDPRARRFRAYVERLTVAVGHADRHAPMRAYLTGLCLPGERKSIEPMAARVDPRHVRARHQSMHHFVANAPWDGGAVLRVARDWVLAPMTRHGRVAAWIVDDTGYPKKGRHSVGVARQYCGALGQTGQLSGGRQRVAGERRGESSGRVSAVPAGELGAGSAAPPDCGGAGRRGVPAEVAARPEPDPDVAGRGDAAGARRGGCRLRRHDRVSRGSEGGGSGLRGRDQKGDDGVASRPDPVAAEAVAGRAWPSVDPRATDGTASAGEPQAPGRRTARLRVADGDVARGHARGDALPLCPAPSPARASRREAIRAPPGGRSA